LLVNGYFGVYKEMWTYAKPINILGISILCGANAYEYYLKKRKHKIAIFGIIVQLAGLIYGIVNRAEDIIVMCLIFMFVSIVAIYDKNEKPKP